MPLAVSGSLGAIIAFVCVCASLEWQPGLSLRLTQTRSLRLLVVVAAGGTGTGFNLKFVTHTYTHTVAQKRWEKVTRSSHTDHLVYSCNLNTHKSNG